MFDVKLIWEYWPIIMRGFPMTLTLTAISMVFGVFFGLIIALIKIDKVPVLKEICALYVSFIRGTPLLVLLYMTYYATPIIVNDFNIRFGTNIDINGISPFTFALMAFIVQESAY